MKCDRNPYGPCSRCQRLRIECVEQTRKQGRPARSDDQFFLADCMTPTTPIQIYLAPTACIGTPVAMGHPTIPIGLAAVHPEAQPNKKMRHESQVPSTPVLDPDHPENKACMLSLAQSFVSLNVQNQLNHNKAKPAL